MNQYEFMRYGIELEDTQQHNFEEGFVFAGCGVMGSEVKVMSCEL